MLAISAGIAKEGAWDRLPILADALQDADCNDEAILGHLRAEQVMVGHRYHDKKSNVVIVSLPERMHDPGKFPNRNGGCWEGTCWVVRALLEKTQRLVAFYEERPSWNARPVRSYRGEDDVIHGHQLVPVVNPGGANGQTWLVTYATSHSPPSVMVEADNPTDAEDEFVESVFGRDAYIDPKDTPDYIGPHDEIRCGVSSNGTWYDSESINIAGLEGANPPFGCLYLGPGLPRGGICPTEYTEYIERYAHG